MSIFLKMAWRNIRRNLRCTLITLSAITFGLAAMIAFFGFTDGFHAQWVENTVKAYTGHIQIYSSGYRDDPQLNRSIANAAEIIKELKTEPAVDTYTERVEVQGLISTAENSYGVLIRGIDPGAEVKITGIKERIIKGEYLNEDKGRGVLIGHRLAEKLNAEIGDKIVLMVQAADGSLTMLMSIMERTREFGIMMAVGTSPGNVILLVMLESFFIGIIGIISGAGIGIGINRIISIKGFDLSRWGGATEFFAILDPVIYPETDLINVLWSCAIVFLTALIVSVYPAVRAARLRPVEAMHYV